MDRIELEKFLDFLNNKGIYLCKELRSENGWQSLWSPLTEGAEKIEINNFIQQQ